MVGIGGIGMQALADVLLGMGHKVTGSDIKDFSAKQRLEAKGAVVLIGTQKEENVPDDIDELIYSSVINKHFPDNNHPELVKAKGLGIDITKRAEFIGKLMEDRVGIAISGTHGKTTTTTLITLILQAGNLNPTALIGAEVKSLQGCGILGDEKYMVVEACEYDRSFLDMKPKIAVITNIEEDHLDYYEDITEIKNAFTKFIKSVPKDGLVVVNGDDKNIQEILNKAKAKVITFGFDDKNDIQATDIRVQDRKMMFRVGDLETYLSFPGKHLVLDALAAIVVARYLKIDDKIIHQALIKFEGARRRFEIIGQHNGVTFVDDYAHHPTEILAMLESSKDYFGNSKIKVIFQPHQFSRTKFLLDQFAQSFINADEVLVAPILPVRDTEEDKKSVNTKKLVEEINKISHNAKEMADFDEVTDYLNKNIKSGDIILSMGAGKNSDWIHEFWQEFKNRNQSN